MLDVRGLSVHFGGLRAVDNVDFVVRQREILGLVGPNGAGKTTIFNTISGMLKPSAGTIRLRGEDITGLASERINALGVARTFQNVRPFAELSVRENIMMGAYGAGFCGVFASALRLPRHRQLERTAQDRADQWIGRLGLSSLCRPAHDGAAVRPAARGRGGARHGERSRPAAARRAGRRPQRD